MADWLFDSWANVWRTVVVGALAEGVAAFVTLIALQFVVAWLSVRSTWVSRLVKSEPPLLLYKGQLLPDALRRMRVTEGEVRSAVRQQGSISLEQVEAVVLETEGSFTVMGSSDAQPATALAHVRGYEGAVRQADEG